MNDQKQPESMELELAQKVRDACVEAAKEGFRDASIQGLCSEGAVEAALSSVQMLDLETIVAETKDK